MALSTLHIRNSVLLVHLAHLGQAGCSALAVVARLGFRYLGIRVWSSGLRFEGLRFGGFGLRVFELGHLGF